MGFFIEADLIHDTRLFCMRLRIDGIETMSSGTPEGKQVKNIATTNRPDQNNTLHAIPKLD